MMLLGMPDIDREKALALSLAGRAVLRREHGQPRAPANATAASLLRNALAAHVKAKAELEVGAIANVSLSRPGGRNTVYDRSNLAALERAIERLRIGVSLDERVLA